MLCFLVRNRHFRMIWSCKAGKAHVLTPTSRFATAPGMLPCSYASEIIVPMHHRLLSNSPWPAAVGNYEIIKELLALLSSPCMWPKYPPSALQGIFAMAISKNLTGIWRIKIGIHQKVQSIFLAATCSCCNGTLHAAWNVLQASTSHSASCSWTH